MDWGAAIRRTAGTLALAAAAGGGAFGQEVEYAVEEVADGLYRFSAGHYRSVFLVTEQGAFVADPIDEQAAGWLKRTLSERFDCAVRYVAYSHNHFDHSSGGQALADEGTVFISHRLARESMRRTKVDTRLPELVFNDELTAHLGDKSVELRYHGVNNGHGSVSMLFQPGRTLFVVDWIVLGRMPYRDLKGYDLLGMIESTRAVLALDWDRIVCGHGAVGGRAETRRYLAYLEELYASVTDGILMGKSLEQLQAELRFPEYADWDMYEEWLPLNIAGAYRYLNDRSYLDMRAGIE